MSLVPSRRPRGLRRPTQPAAPAAADNSQFSLREVFEVLLRSKWQILGLVLLVTLAAWFYTSRQTPTYMAGSIVYVDFAGTLAPEQALVGTETRSMQNELAILNNSSDVMEETAEQLTEVAQRENLELPLLATPDGSVPAPERLAAMLRARVSFTAVGGADMIQIAAMSSDAREAKEVANAAADAYQSFSRKLRGGARVRKKEFLEKVVADARQELEVKEGALTSYKEQTGAVALGPQGEQLVAQASSLDAQLSQAELELQVARAQLADYNSRLEQLGSNLAGDATTTDDVTRQIESLNTRIGELESDIALIFANNPGLSRDESTYTGRLKTLNDQLKSYQAQRNQLYQARAGGLLGGTTNFEDVAQLKSDIVIKSAEVDGLEERVQSLRARVNRANNQLTRVPAQSAQLAQLQREYESAAETYSSRVAQLRDAELALEAEPAYVTIIKEATQPFFPVSPNMMQNLILGALLGLMFGVGLALVRRAASSTIFKPADVQRGGHEVLGVIPKMNRYIKTTFNGKESMEIGNGEEHSTTLISLHDPWSYVAESYRYVRMQVQLGLPHKAVQTVLVTSAEPGDGKSTTAVNLAIAMALSGHRTLCVEADMRRPGLSQRLGMPAEPGLGDILDQGQAHPWKQFATGIENLYFLPSGSSVPNPSELLSTTKMQDFIAYLRENFDYIVFDSPPVLVVTDALALAAQCDVTVLVASAGKTDLRSLDQARDKLVAVGATYIGTILNRGGAQSATGHDYDRRYYNYHEYHTSRASKKSA